MKKKLKLKKPTNRKSTPSKKSNWLTPLIILSVVALGTAIWYSLPRPTPVGINLVGSDTGTVNLSFTPLALETQPNVEVIATLNVGMTSSQITAMQIELSYDSTQIGVPVVTLTDYLSNVLSPVTTTDNKIAFAVAIPPAGTGVSGGATIATFKIKPLIAGTSTLTFTENTMVSVVGTQANMLKSVTNLTVNSTSPASPSVSPSVIPSTPASADPSIAASPSVSPSLSPSPSPSAPAGEKPAKPTGLRSNCYDGGNKITLRWDAVSGVDSYKVRLDQKDGSNDKSNDGIKSTEYNYDIIAGQKYSWWVHSVKAGLDSEEAKIDEVVCDKTTSSTNATPTPTPTATPKSPAKKATATPKPTTATKATPTPSSSTTQYTAKTNTTGSLNDVFTNPDAVDSGDGSATTTENKNFWQKFLEWLGNLFIPSGN